MKLLLIDGSSMLTTAYYGTLPNEIKWEKDEEKRKLHYDKILHNSIGEYTNAIYSMLKSLSKILDYQKPTHMAICFDKSRENTFRRKMYSEYKAQRSETPFPLKQQMINMEKFLKMIGFSVFYSDEYEADDFVGTLAKKFENQIDTYLYTKDHDYLQLVSDKTKLWLLMVKQEDVDSFNKKHNIDTSCLNIPDKVVELTPQLVKDEFGVYPCQIADLKGLQGDSADNIPGVYGISSAAPILISKYGSVENLYDEIEKIYNDKKSEKLFKEELKTLGVTRSPLNMLMSDCDKRSGISAKETALLSKKLATIYRDIPLDVTLKDLEFEIDWFAYTEILNRLDIRKI